MFKINKIEISSQVVSELDGNRFNSEDECIAWVSKLKESGLFPGGFDFQIAPTDAEEQSDRVKKETKHTDRLSRVDQLKAIDWNLVTTFNDQQKILKLLVKEAIKDDE